MDEAITPGRTPFRDLHGGSLLCRLVPLLVLCACTSGPAYLTGSIGETLPLGFDRARIRLQDAWLVVDYLRDHPSGTETV